MIFCHSKLKYVLSGLTNVILYRSCIKYYFFEFIEVILKELDYKGVKILISGVPTELIK